MQRNNQNQAVQLTQLNSIDDNEQQQQQAHVVHYKVISNGFYVVLIK